MLLGFGLAFFGFVALVVGRIVESKGRAPGTPLAGAPGRLVVVLSVLCSVAAASAIAGVISTGGYSQNPRWQLARCEWSIGTDHGATSLCVPHSRWLATGEGFQHLFLSASGVFLCLDCAAWAAHARRLAAHPPGETRTALPDPHRDPRR
jgi:hypothetical protein